MTIKAFSPEIHAQLNYYVYKLIDPRNGEIFYVGKGYGNRLFAHVNYHTSQNEFKNDIEDAEDLKAALIQDIIKSGLDVLHVVHRHGMTENEALLAEAVLIDAIAGLSNIQAGKHSNDFGPMNALLLEQQYKLPEFEIQPDHKLILINIRKSYLENTSVYDAVRMFWRMDKSKAEKADYVLAVNNGIVEGIFVVDSWLDATVKNFPQLSQDIKRIAFIGHPANADIQSIYMKKRVAEQFANKKGAQNPIRYSY